jgi:hypothetical protein
MFSWNTERFIKWLITDEKRKIAWIKFRTLFDNSGEKYTISLSSCSLFSLTTLAGNCLTCSAILARRGKVMNYRQCAIREERGGVGPWEKQNPRTNRCSSRKSYCVFLDAKMFWGRDCCFSTSSFQRLDKRKWKSVIANAKSGSRNPSLIKVEQCQIE